MLLQNCVKNSIGLVKYFWKQKAKKIFFSNLTKNLFIS